MTALLMLLLLAVAAPARADEGRPAILRDVGFEQRLGERLPLDATFRDEHGKTVRLGDYFGDKPVLIVPAYYECPMLCTMVLNGVAGALKALPFTVGKEFRVVTFSFNPKETSTLALAKQAAYLDRYGHPEAADGWHFLTGDEPQIRALTEAIGFHYAWDPVQKQYAHASGVVLATPDGRLTRYFYGIDLSPRDLRLALVEASENRIGSFVDQVLLFCFHYDPATGKYGALAIGAVRVAGLLTVIGLAAFIAVMLRRERTRAA